MWFFLCLSYLRFIEILRCIGKCFHLPTNLEHFRPLFLQISFFFFSYSSLSLSSPSGAPITCILYTLCCPKVSLFLNLFLYIFQIELFTLFFLQVFHFFLLPFQICGWTYLISFYFNYCIFQL